MGSLQCAPMGAWGPGKLGDGLTRSEWLWDWLWGPYLALWLVLSWKQAQKLGKLSVIDRILAIWGQLLEMLLIGWLDCHKETAGCPPGPVTVEDGLASWQLAGRVLVLCMV